MRKGKYPNHRIHIHASSAAASASSGASASASLTVGPGLYLERSHMQAAQKKCSNHHSPQFPPTFATLVSQPIQTQPIMTCEAPPSSFWVYMCFTFFSPQEQPRHISWDCSLAGASASAMSSEAGEAGSWQWSSLSTCQASWVSCDSTNTKIIV